MGTSFVNSFAARPFAERMVIEAAVGGAVGFGVNHFAELGYEAPIAVAGGAAAGVVLGEGAVALMADADRVQGIRKADADSAWDEFHKDLEPKHVQTAEKARKVRASENAGADEKVDEVKGAIQDLKFQAEVLAAAVAQNQGNSSGKPATKAAS